MSISAEEVAAIARLARLEIEPADVPRYAEQLSRVLRFVDEMNQVSTDGVEPMSHPLDLPARLRADEVTETDQRELFQAQAPAVEKGLYLVPRVVE